MRNSLLTLLFAVLMSCNNEPRGTFFLGKNDTLHFPYYTLAWLKNRKDTVIMGFKPLEENTFINQAALELGAEYYHEIDPLSVICILNATEFGVRGYRRDRTTE